MKKNNEEVPETYQSIDAFVAYFLKNTELELVRVAENGALFRNPPKSGTDMEFIFLILEQKTPDSDEWTFQGFLQPEGVASFMRSIAMLDSSDRVFVTLS